jgi:hypothetical protein
MNRLLGFASLSLSVVALAVSFWGPRETAAPTPSSERPAAASSSQDVRALEQRVKALEETAQLLSRRMLAYEQRPVAAGDGGAVAAPVALAAEVEQLKAEVRAMVAGEALHSEGGREYLKEMVRTAQEEVRAEQRQERQQQWVQAQAQAQQARGERWRQFVSEAGLNYTQEQELTRRLEAEETRRQALMEEVRTGVKSPRDVRQEMRALRTQTDEEMKQLLSAEQQAKYTELRREERPRGGGRQQAEGAQP